MHTSQLIYEDERIKTGISSSTRIADRTEFWWDPKRPNEPTLWESKIASARTSSTRSSATPCRST